eukprot:SAG31_NODE_2817_length_5042_cov_32.133522_4_plen_80_part_00
MPTYFLPSSTQQFVRFQACTRAVAHVRGLQTSSPRLRASTDTLLMVFLPYIQYSMAILEQPADVGRKRLWQHLRSCHAM